MGEREKRKKYRKATKKNNTMIDEGLFQDQPLLSSAVTINSKEQLGRACAILNPQPKNVIVSQQSRKRKWMSTEETEEKRREIGAQEGLPQQDEKNGNNLGLSFSSSSSLLLSNNQKFHHGKKDVQIWERNTNEADDGLHQGHHPTSSSLDSFLQNLDAEITKLHTTGEICRQWIQIQRSNLLLLMSGMKKMAPALQNALLSKMNLSEAILQASGLLSRTSSRGEKTKNISSPQQPNFSSSSKSNRSHNINSNQHSFSPSSSTLGGAQQQEKIKFFCESREKLLSNSQQLSERILPKFLPFIFHQQQDTPGADLLQSGPFSSRSTAKTTMQSAKITLDSISPSSVTSSHEEQHLMAVVEKLFLSQITSPAFMALLPLLHRWILDMIKWNEEFKTTSISSPSFQANFVEENTIAGTHPSALWGERRGQVPLPCQRGVVALHLLRNGLQHYGAIFSPPPSTSSTSGFCGRRSPPSTSALAATMSDISTAVGDAQKHNQGGANPNPLHPHYSNLMSEVFVVKVSSTSMTGATSVGDQKDFLVHPTQEFYKAHLRPQLRALLVEMENFSDEIECAMYSEEEQEGRGQVSSSLSSVLFISQHLPFSLSELCQRLKFLAQL